MDYKKIMDSLFKENFELGVQCDQYEEERDMFIDDLSWYEEKVSKLEDEKDDMLLEREYYKNRYEDMTRRCKEMEQENNNLKQSVSEYKDYAESHVANYLEFKALEHENEQLKEELLQSDYVKASVFSDREEYKKQIVKLQEELETTEQKNVGLKLMNESSDKQLEIFHRCFNSLLTKLDINKDKDNLLSEISQHIGNKPSSSKYKYFREKLDGIGIKEDE